MGHFWLQIVLVNEMSFFYEERYRSQFLFIAHGLRGNIFFAKNDRFEQFLWISEGHRAHLRVLMLFRARTPYLKAIR